MRSTRLAFLSAALCSLLLAAAAHAAGVSGTVTNKTTGKPSGGDKVELVDVQAGMNVVSTATTDSKGHYTLNEPGSGPYLIRATHQGASYFIAAPQGGGPGDIGVYDAAAKVNGISIEAQIYQLETQNGQLSVTVSWVVHNNSSPKVTQFSNNTFEFALPPGAILEGAQATRPSGLPTLAMPKPLDQKDHYTFNLPIEPDQGDKSTQFQIGYHLPYSGSYTFKPIVLTSTDNLAVELPKSMTFTPAGGASYQPIPHESSVQTFLLKNALPGSRMDFTVSGEGAMPREQQQGGAPDAGGQPAQQGPGGGIGAPINTPDPLSKYKWWILGGLGLLLAAAAAFLLRRPAGGLAGAVPATAGGPAISHIPVVAVPSHSASVVHSTASAAAAPAPAAAAGRNPHLLIDLKEELFALETEKLSGALNAAEYAEQKAALEIVMKRALKKTS
jgi:hypothetical protein